MSETPSGGGARRAAKSRRAEKPSRAERARRAKAAKEARRADRVEEAPVESPVEETSADDVTADATTVEETADVETADDDTTGSVPVAAARSRRAGRPGTSGRSGRAGRGRSGRSGRPARPGRPAVPAEPGARSTAVAGLVLVLLAAAAVGLTRPSEATGRPSATQLGDLVSHGAIACPPLPAETGADSEVKAGTLGATGLGSGGSLRQGPVTDAGSAITAERGRLTELDGVSGSAVVTGQGQLAAGLFGYRADRDGDTLATTPCLPPRASWWFTGAGATLDHGSTLTLANVDAGPAVVDLRVLGPRGEVETVGTRGITLGSGDEKTFDLDEVAPQTGEIALSVQASRGRVLAAVADHAAPSAGAAQGSEWLRGDVDPSRVVRISGIPTSAAKRTLLISNPSDREAVVDIDAAGSSGRFVPSGLDTQSVPPASVVSVDLPSNVGKGEDVSLRLRSQVPVLGTVRSQVGADTIASPAVLPVGGESAVPVPSGAKARVELTAGGNGAQVDVTAYDAKGTEVASKSLKLAAGATSAWAPKSGKAAYVVVSPQSGNVYGAATYDGGGASAFPLIELPLQQVQPVVNQALR